MKKIKFHPINSVAEHISDSPSPSSKIIPDWFKQMDTVINHDYEYRNPDNTSNKTVKKCIPFIDALTTGYMITLPCDVVFVDPTKYDGARAIWDVSWQVLEHHTPGQVSRMPIPDNYESVPLKWTTIWSAQTPPEYSLLFTHPLNRFDLPFLTMSGVVDTDTYKCSVNLPFLIKKGFMGKIEKGTPLAQIIPLKREHWISEKTKYDDKQKIWLEQLRTIVDSSYRLRWWNKKTYE